MSKDASIPSRPADWAVSPSPVPYELAVAAMERRRERVASGRASELVWLLEHPPLVTAGTSARVEELLDPGRFPVHATGRGGRFTYHGPGQRVVYTVLDVRGRFGGDVRAFVATLEGWVIEALAIVGADGQIRPGHPGVWIARGDGLAKVTALGVRIARGVSMHGIAINVAPDLEHFRAIVPCGIEDAGVTSLAALGLTAGMGELDAALRTSFERRLGPARDVPLDAVLAGHETEAPGTAFTVPGAL